MVSFTPQSQIAHRGFRIKNFAGLWLLLKLVIGEPGLGTAFFYVLNALFFCILLNHATFFYVLFSSFWGLMRPKRTMPTFAFFS